MVKRKLLMLGLPVWKSNNSSWGRPRMVARSILISPEHGELPITPDSPEWFEWVESLSSFRFVGREGRFSARRGFSQRPNRGWYAQRTIHQQFRGKSIGVSEYATLSRLYNITAELQLPV